MKTYIGNGGGGGFTMIEVVVVLVIIGILAGLMATQFTGSKIKANVENGVRQVFSDLMEMRVKAMSDNTNYSITWTFDSNNDFQSYTKSSGIAAALLNK
ncbi:MAG: prepilin-type N-terminal cleavage/methylation domain-containing protein, partial [Nitrospirae bacterium]|nr:prepilin-type N-terminal cleavage/methylation domain-containing protein [Nitrospirota bacterium]